MKKAGPQRIGWLIGETRFELATSASRTQRSVQTELLPGHFKADSIIYCAKMQACNVTN